MNLGNGQSEQGTYVRQQPTQMQVGTQLTLQYYYCPNGGSSCTSNNGNLLRQRITTPALALTQDYTYTDGFNRLTSGTETNSQQQVMWSQTYQYDAYGNRAVTAGYIPYPGLTPTSLSQFTQNRVTGSEISYDNAGNLLSMPGSRGYSYDAENRVKSSTQPLGVGTVQYAYDGDGRRVQKTVSGGTTTYVYDADGNLAADYGASTNLGTSYLSVDHLGSTRLVTDASGVVKKRYDYFPFGEDLQQGLGGRDNTYAAGAYPGVPDIGPVKFTGEERDAESGLDYFGARYFSGAQGRFTSPDPKDFPSHYDDPQSWNKYVYVRNNPLRLVDPDGRDWLESVRAFVYSYFEPAIEAHRNNYDPQPPSTSGPIPTMHDIAKASVETMAKGTNLIADAADMLDPTGIGAATRSGLTGDTKGMLLAMGGLLIPGESKEIRVANETFEQARNAGLKALGELGSVARTDIVGKQGGMAGLVTGFQTRVGGVFKAFRLDFDPKKGAHINVTVGKTKYSFEFKATEEQVKKLLEGNVGR